MSLLTGWLRRSGLMRLVKFGLVGASGVVVYYGFLALFVEVVGVAPRYGSAIAAELAVVNNFVWNDVFTFGQRLRRVTKQWLVRFLRFHAVCFAGVILSTGVMALAVDVFGLHYLLAGMFCVIASAAWNYAASCLWVWRVQFAGSRPRF